MSPASPVSFAVDVRRLPRKGMPVRIVADAEQRAALAEMHGLESVGRFQADLLVQDWRRDGVKVSGHVTASIVQACVVTLEPVPAAIDELVEALFLPEGSKLAMPGAGEGGEMLLSPEGPDAPELFEGDEIDVGALAEQLFALAIDPYPRAPGAGPAGPFSTDPSPDKDDSPFAALGRLAKKS